jgi:ATP-binding cassette subfamily B protein
VGQRALRLNGEASQRVAIARALLRDPDILLLDEVASALDANQEEAIDATLRAIAPGRTVISITHRLSSAADADRIYVFDQGRIVEEGSHYELMALEGFYANLWRKQAGFRFSSDGGHVDVDAARLKQFPILEKLPHDVLAELAPYFTTRTFPRGREIVCQNDPGDQFYIIARGTVGVWRTEEQTGNIMRVAVLQDGDFFGEITLITGFPRTATVRTETVCTCISLGRGQFNRLIDRFPDLRRELSDVAVQRLRESSKAITVPAP